ncbi:C4b-binding protein alpha chain isoform X3 [Oryzias latipes]|uniref:C4b-binding protein alpha chain isoform X3 n=1 Tax=Oryzias latipes TaxID=8090 RepID=UPI0009D976C4|nr:C4b-binding protein alpha chain isoform X3 [Oryzias latipes]
MRSAAGILLLLSFALLSSAQVAQECSIPREFQGARLVRDYPSTVKFNSGDRVYYGCRDGFTPMDGKPFVECRNGAWSKLTLQCEQGEPTCLAPVVANSAQRAGTVYQVGDRINLSCKIGFQLEGPNEITCAPNGQWQPKPPQCVPTLERTQPRTEQTNEKGDCEAPPPVIGSNAYLVDKYAMMTSFSSGDKVYYSCNVGYTARAGSRSRRCKNGKWTQLKLKCERKLCGHAGEIENGHFVYTGVKFGDVATAKCNEGYILVGRATRNCRSQGWDGRIPVCEVAICDKPKKTNAISKGPEEPPYRYRSVIRYQCQVGMLDGPREIYCTSNGTWNASPPQCKEFTCPPPNVPHAYWMGAHREKFNAMDVISIDCDRGYSIQGPTSITCSRDGRWIPSLPSCQPAHRPQY